MKKTAAAILAVALILLCFPAPSALGEGVEVSAPAAVLMEAGTGRVLYDGGDEPLSAGSCHYCPKGHAHSLINDGGELLEFFAVVPNQ